VKYLTCVNLTFSSWRSTWRHGTLRHVLQLHRKMISTCCTSVRSIDQNIRSSHMQPCSLSHVTCGTLVKHFGCLQLYQSRWNVPFLPHKIKLVNKIHLFDVNRSSSHRT
jgi:hypothetical protein